MQKFEKFLSEFSKLGKKVDDLSRIDSLMKALGEPQKKIKFVHIAGTNGKGSIAEMLSHTLTLSGYKTGLFTSPYIIRYNDRIRVNGKDIGDEVLNELTEMIEPTVRKIGVEFSQFEITQALAFLYFVQQKCDIVVLETGLGGKLDSTNIIPPPLAAVITLVSFDHTAILGNTIEEIAEQKAGIIKKGTKVVMSAGNSEDVIDIVKSRAKALDSSLVIPNIDDLKITECDVFGNEFEYQSVAYRTKMGGYHQIINALTVINTVRELDGFTIGDEAIIEGLKAQVPARLEILCDKPLVLLDGGHNPAGLRALANALDTLKCSKYVVIGMLKDKDSESAVNEIVDHADKFICVDGFYPTARPADDLAQLIRNAGADTEIAVGDLYTIVREVFENIQNDDVLVICGSLFLAAKFAGRKELFEEKR